MWRSRIDNAGLAVTFGLLILALTGCTSTGISKPSVPEQINTLNPVPSIPFLRLETGMHTAPINRIAVDAQERYLVTASQDKTARVWELATGRLLQILRPPIGQGNEGLLDSVAITPDGETIALGGWTGSSAFTDKIYLFDRQSGQLKQTIGNLPNVIKHLAYSSDGRYLAAAFGGKNGIRIYSSRNLAKVADDPDYGYDSYWVEFDGEGRLVSSSWDGYIRLYSSDFKLLTKKMAPGGKRPYAVRFSPQGDYLAVGFDDSTAVNVLSGQDLSLRYVPDTSNIRNSNLGSVAWSFDGQILYAGGTPDDGTENNPIFRWAQAGHGGPTAWNASQTTIMDMRSLSKHKLVFGAGDPSAGLLDSDGQKIWQHTPGLVDHRGNESQLHVSNDGSLIDFGFDTFSDAGYRNERRAQFDLNRLRLDVPAVGAATSKLSPARTEVPGLAITGLGTTEPKLNGEKIPLEPYERSRSLAIAADQQHFLFGTEWYLRFFDRQGRQQWKTDFTGDAYAINISGDGKFAVAALGDGTIRWYQLDSRKEVLALFPNADGQRWVAWTPEGFFSDGGSGGKDLIEYHLNQGHDRERQVVQVEQLYDLFYRPDLVARALQEDGQREIQMAVAKIGDVRQVLTGGLPPDVEIVSQKVDGLNLKLEIKLTDRGGGVGNLVYRVNGVEQAGRGGVPVTIPGFTKVSIPLALRNNDVSITAYNSQNTIESRAAKAKPIFIDAVAINKPSLYALAVGVTQYRDPSMNLKYAADDARAMSATLKQHGNRLFEKIEITTLPDDEATLANITAAFAQLARQVKENDVFLLYLAGHGLVIQGAYHFVPHEARYTSEPHIQEASLSENKLRELLKTIVSKKSLIILDTCYSGKALQLASVPGNFIARGLDEKTAITKLNRATGRAVLAASSDGQLAFEGYNGHGFFTSALLDGLNGQAIKNKDAEISTLDLIKYVESEVPARSKDRQFPQHESQGSDFAISTTE